MYDAQIKLVLDSRRIDWSLQFIATWVSRLSDNPLIKLTRRVWFVVRDLVHMVVWFVAYASGRRYECPCEVSSVVGHLEIS